MHEVLLDDQGNVVFGDVTEHVEEAESAEPDLESLIHERYKCVKCGNDECEIKEVAMTGTGLSKIFDVQYNHYLFVSCMRCSYVEVYNPNILAKGARGSLGTVMDILFGN
ncbi:zinc ribbon domain-containing protein [Paenibacillus sp.]|uniref:zinc ribbon domain-containing protein n=1 Tax=Paenibacillus sp. TaxID=58172 RepID=UPI002D7090B9|nr:zinc ribbon domain-containing protein [Paenibacillus sp.]HZG86723.1 zinc ribbon domain-containing protein [Paenibacillus sp.]